MAFIYCNVQIMVLLQQCMTPWSTCQYYYCGHQDLQCHWSQQVCLTMSMRMIIVDRIFWCITRLVGARELYWMSDQCDDTLRANHENVQSFMEDMELSLLNQDLTQKSNFQCDGQVCCLILGCPYDFFLFSLQKIARD